MKKPTIQNASAIKWPDRILVLSSTKTESGFRILSAPFIPLPIDASIEEIGYSINTALVSNKFNIRDPDWKDKTLKIERFNAARVKSEKAYMTDARLVHIFKDAEKITITPTINGGTKGAKKGFEEIIDQKAEIDLNSSEKDIGMKVKEMWSKCITL